MVASFYQANFISSEFLKIYDRLGTRLIERGESFYQPMMPDIAKDLESKGKAICNVPLYSLLPNAYINNINST